MVVHAEVARRVVSLEHAARALMADPMLHVRMLQHIHPKW